MSKNNKKSSLSDKIANILSTTPGNLDPEDDIYEETKAKVTETFESDESDDVQSSKFRKQNVDLLENVDKKYSGKTSSRKDLKDSDEDWETEDEGLSTDEGEDLDGIPGTQEYASGEDDSVEEESDESADDYGDEDENFKHMSDTNLPIQQKKGNAVRNQLNVWENLLEMRIQLQKCLLTSNKLPQHDLFKEINTGDFKSAVKVTQRNVSNMLENFLSLQNLLLKQYGETKLLLKEKKKETTENESNEEIPSDTEEEKSESESENDEVPHKRRKLTEFESEIEGRNEKYKSYRNSVIQKWNDKTRLAVSKSSTASNSVLQQIEYILSDNNKLVRKTQMKRSEFEIVGKSREVAEKTKDKNNREPEEYDTEIYDDTDFYHQLLRELIEVKSGDITDPVQMSRQWIALQNLRSKMKRKIDTKATKGRKIRYVVHSKLVNFMAPINESSWTEEAKNELFSSLFSNNKISS